MHISPELKEFQDKYNKDINQLVWSKLSADLQTPVSVALKLGNKDYSILCESVEKGVNRARYSFLAIDPDLIWRFTGGQVQINENPEDDLNNFKDVEKDVFVSLREIINQTQIDIPDELPAMSFGVYGFMGYDMVKYMEKLPDNNKSQIKIPDACYIRPKVVLVFDSVKDDLLVITPVFKGQKDAKSAYDDAISRLNNVIKQISKPLAEKHFLGRENSVKSGDIEFSSNTEYDKFCKNIDKAKEYILNGDIFQVVLSQRFSIDFPHSAFTFYRELRRLNPSPFSFYMKFADFTLVGSSPEILVRVRDKTVTVRPIAGTRPRGKDKHEDQELKEDLLNDPKELAEHLMLLDLGRNDIGRVAKVGTVDVSEQMEVEFYSHVMHITSKVNGQLKDDYDALDALIAGFPAGTVSGAPKIRAMEIIDELEPEKRNYYAGGVGYFSSNGDMDTCITLRTALIKDNKLYVQAGGGIVADSVPDSEYKESCNKAKALLKAAEIVINGENK